MWLRQHLDDICSDLSVFHRIDDFTELDGPTFWKLAWRLAAYQGRMAVVIQDLQDQQSSSKSPQGFTAQAVPAVVATAEVIRGHQAAQPAPQLMQDAPVISYSQAPAD